MLTNAEEIRLLTAYQNLRAYWMEKKLEHVWLTDAPYFSLAPVINDPMEEQIKQLVQTFLDEALAQAEGAADNAAWGDPHDHDEYRARAEVLDKMVDVFVFKSESWKKQLDHVLTFGDNLIVRAAELINAG